MATLTLSTGNGVTFAEWRMRLALEMRDGIVCTATANGNSSTFFDVENLVDNYDAYVPSQVIFYETANPLLVGKVATIGSSNPENGSITFMQPLPADPVAGDTLLMINMQGRGWRKQLYDFFMQQVVIESYPNYLLDFTDTSLVEFDSDVPYIAIPPEFRAVYGIWTQDDTNVWREVPSVRTGNAGMWGEGYRIDATTRTIWVEGDCWRGNMDGAVYTIGGYAAHPKPVSETDLIVLDPEWFKTACMAKLATRRAGTREWDSWAVEWSRTASDLKGNILTPRKPNTLFLA
jgi:hypothetical protein